MPKTIISNHLHVGSMGIFGKSINDLMLLVNSCIYYILIKSLKHMSIDHFTLFRSWDLNLSF